MKVLLVNGSPHANGCAFTALSEVAGALEKNGIETNIIHLGTKPISGCLGCRKCFETGKCIINDIVNEFIDMSAEYDGFIFGSPVHFAAPTGALTSFMDRAFFGPKSKLALKPAAAVFTCRRGGATAAFDQVNKYFSISNMPIVSSQYWNMAHGNTPEEVKQDLEGMQILRVLGNNMAWLLKCIEAGKKSGVELPQQEQRVGTNFIR